MASTEEALDSLSKTEQHSIVYPTVPNDFLDCLIVQTFIDGILALEI